MWKAYSSDYIKNNRSSGLAIRIAAFLSALLLSLLCGILYNLWKYEVERIKLEQGAWLSRITGELTPEELEMIRGFAHIENVVVKEGDPKGTEPTVELYFSDKRAVFQETAGIAEQLGIAPERLAYNYELLAMYLIRSPEDPAPRLIFPLFLLITLAASFSLIVLIHNAFAVSMNARVHQFGVFSSIGATPGQIRACLLQEAAALCAVPVVFGDLLGIAGSAGVLQLTNVLLGNDVPGRHAAVFGYHPLVLALTLLATVATIGISAWIPARKLSRLAPLDAIRTAGEFHLNRRKRARLLPLLFGAEGELAGNALKAQRKVLRTSTLSFLFSFLAFSLMQCFFTLSEISTRETYFERYQDVWDIMVTLRDTDADAFEKTADLQALDGVEGAIVYQKAAAKRLVKEEELSEEMKAMGGFSHASGREVTQTEGGWLVNAPIVIMDDSSFSAYCQQIGIAPRLDGAIVLNQIRDVTNPDFRHPVFMPYLRTAEDHENASDADEKDAGSEKDFSESDGHAVTVLRRNGKEEMTAEVPVLSWIQGEEVPPLREEYAKLDYYELVHFIPLSLWKEIKGQIEGAEEDSFICIKCRENVTLEELDALQEKIGRLIGGAISIEQENRIQEYESNKRMMQGMKAFLGSFCVLFAIIGVGNVFSNTFGFVRQRRREFARYLSIGMTPGQFRNMFCTEALVVAGRPVLFSFPIVILATGIMLRASYMDMSEFLAEAPLVPILLFLLAIVGSVALAYALAWRNVRKIRLAEVLRDDTML